MEQKEHLKTEGQRRQLANQNQEGIDKEPIGPTDYILNFRTACLNRSVDIRNFADGRDSFAINNDEREHLKGLTEMLTEQTEFLEDAWETMIRYARKYKIDLDRDDAYQALVLARDHALRVAEQAFSISDRFLYPQLAIISHEADKRHGQSKLHKLRGTTAKNSENAEQPRRIDENEASTAAEHKQAVYATIEAIIAKTEDVSGPLVERERKEEEESEHEDPEEIIVLDKLITALKKGRKFDGRQDIREKAHLKQRSKHDTEMETEGAGRKATEMTDHDIIYDAQVEKTEIKNVCQHEVQKAPGKIDGPATKSRTEIQNGAQKEVTGQHRK